MLQGSDNRFRGLTLFIPWQIAFASEQIASVKLEEEERIGLGMAVLEVSSYLALDIVSFSFSEQLVIR